MAEGSKKVSWNASQGIIMEIQNRRNYANTSYINGNIKKAFKNLITIKQSVIQSFEKEERDKFKALEEKFNRVSKYLSMASANSFNEEVRNVFHMSIEYASKIYSEYNDLLMDLLEDRGYCISEQTDASRMRF